MGELDQLLAQVRQQGAQPAGSSGGGGGELQSLLEQARQQLAPPEPEQPAPTPPGRSTPGFEPDPNLDPYGDQDPFRRNMLHARDRDLAANDYVSPVERFSEALVGVNAPGARAGGSYLGNLARNGLSGGAQAALSAYRSGVQRGGNTVDAYLDPHNALDALVAGGRGFIMGAGLTGAGTAAGALGSKVAEGADAIGNRLGAAADESRILATGKPAPDVERMGPADRAELAGNIEREGLNNGLGFATPKTYARNATALANRGEQGMRSAEDALAALPETPQVPIGSIIDKHRARAAEVSGLAHPANPGVAGFRNDLIDRLEADTVTPGAGPQATMEPSGWNGHEFKQPGQTVDLPSQQLPWPRALEQRRNLDQNANWQTQGANEPWNNATTKEVANDLRGAVDTSLNAPNVPPALAQQWRTGRDQTALGLGVRDDALNALGQKPHMAIPTSPRAAVAGAAGLGTRLGGYSALAGAQRAGAGLANGVEGVVGSNAEALTGLAQRGGGALGAAAAQNSSVQGWLASKGISAQNVPQQSRGNQLGAAAQRLLETEPQAFGQYQQQIQEAAQQGPEALNTLIGKLEQETPFRTGPMLRLQHMTGEN